MSGIFDVKCVVMIVNLPCIVGFISAVILCLQIEAFLSSIGQIEVPQTLEEQIAHAGLFLQQSKQSSILERLPAITRHRSEHCN